MMAIKRPRKAIAGQGGSRPAQPNLGGMMNDRPEKPADDQPTTPQPAAKRRVAGEILLWLCAFALLFITVMRGIIFLLDNTRTTLNEPIHLIGGDG
jgi:hypothetical protein